MAGAVLVYVLRERHRRASQVRPPRPGINIEEAWEIWRASAPDAAEEALPDLAATAARAAEAVHPRVFLRNAAIESALMALHLEAIAALPDDERAMLLQGYTPGMDGMLRQAQRAHTTRWKALRCYLRLKYDDAVPQDWLDHFRQVAAPYVREKVRLARDYLVQVDSSAGRFVEIYDELLDGLRKEMLRVPPKRRFPPADL